MITTILDWTGTIFIILGNFIITSERSFNPKIKLIALISYLISNILWIPFAILLNIEGLLITQVIFLLTNIKGIYYCIKKIKKKWRLTIEHYIGRL